MTTSSPQSPRQVSPVLAAEPASALPRSASAGSPPLARSHAVPASGGHHSSAASRLGRAEREPETGLKPPASAFPMARAGEDPRAALRGDGQRRAVQGQAAIAAAMSEGELEEKVRQLCEGLGILRFHVPDSRRMGERGLPDDILIGPRGVLWRELKDMKRKLTPEQEKVGAWLTALGQDWATWRPIDLLSRRVEHELRAISGLRTAGGAA